MVRIRTTLYEAVRRYVRTHARRRLSVHEAAALSRAAITCGLAMRDAAGRVAFVMVQP